MEKFDYLCLTITSKLLKPNTDMKIIRLLLLGFIASLLLTTCNSAIPINESTFPDDNFRNFLIASLRISKSNPDTSGKILTPEVISKIKKLKLTSKKIKSLKGIEYFTALRELYIGDNLLTELDVSKNTELEKLVCLSNKLTSLDVSKNLKLENLNCEKNQLTSLIIT